MILAATAEVTVSIPVCDPGLGDIITSPKSPRLIRGVEIETANLWPDDRGFFKELFRFGRGLVADYPADTTQVSAALSYSGTIKAFHYHLRQTDVWAPVAGMFQVALVDLRHDSPTYGCKNTIYVGERRPWHVRIPPGVAHGYKIIGPADGMLVYATDRFYDPADEGRITYDHSSLAYDWTTQHK